MFKDNFLYSCIKGSIIAVFLLVIGIVVFAGFLSFVDVSNNVVKIVNQFIRIIAVFFGCFFAVNIEKGLIKGATVGLLFGIFSNIIFLIIYREAFLFTKALTDTVFITAISSIIGIITVNLKN